jgi:serine/threonine-protein kinase
MTRLQAGDQFSHYQIRSHIAQGGTGDVYHGWDILTGHDAALKILSRAVIMDPRKYDYFLRECAALHGLEHPAIQHEIESGRSDNTPYLATDLINGQSLARMIKTNSPFPVNRAVSLALRIADGLQYCHDQQIIHCDLKPENILITETDQPVIIDFGLAVTPTHAHSLAAGTPEYMAPEQIEGGRCDARTDIYALGTVICAMLTGQSPFAEADSLKVMNMHLHSAAPRLDRLRSDVSPGLATVVAKCLQRDPARRYPNVRALIDDLGDPDRIDPSELDSLCLEPPKTPFHKTPLAQAIIISLVSLIGTLLLGLLLASLKHGR